MKIGDVLKVSTPTFEPVSDLTLKCIRFERDGSVTYSIVKYPGMILGKVNIPASKEINSV
jgi:hypothetical protein